MNWIHKKPPTQAFSKDKYFFFSFIAYTAYSQKTCVLLIMLLLFSFHSCWNVKRSEVTNTATHYKDFIHKNYKEIAKTSHPSAHHYHSDFL